MAEGEEDSLYDAFRELSPIRRLEDSRVAATPTAGLHPATRRLQKDVKSFASIWTLPLSGRMRTSGRTILNPR